MIRVEGGLGENERMEFGKRGRKGLSVELLQGSLTAVGFRLSEAEMQELHGLSDWGAT